jgi:replication-associated recombination protein RarA
MTHFQTRHGFNDDEVTSALQKQIRRGIEDDALYWALELCDDGKNKSGFSRLCHRLLTIAYEDVGLADTGTVLQVSLAVRDMEKMYAKNLDGWRIVLSYVILLLSRTQKSRISDHFLQYIQFVWSQKTPKEMEIAIPDYAIDMHTSRGTLMGRSKGSLKGIDHFILEGEKLENENEDIQDVYRAEAHRLLRLGKK